MFLLLGNFFYLCWFKEANNSKHFQKMAKNFSHINIVQINFPQKPIEWTKNVFLDKKNVFGLSNTFLIPLKWAE